MSYQIIIVDDEDIIARGIERSLPWARMEITEVYIANNIRKAKEIFDEHSIDILLCDIEMPKGNGFELLRWVNDNYPKTKTIFLTSHAKFDYAQKAIQLGSLDYLLKPASPRELKSIINKAIGKIENERRSETFQEIYRHYHDLWNNYHPILIERFWLDLINQVIPSKLHEIMEVIRNQNLPYNESINILPILVTVQQWDMELTYRDERILEYALRNTVAEILNTNNTNEFDFQLVQLKNGNLLILLTSMEESLSYDETLRQDMQLFIDSCNQYFYCQLSCYIGKWGKLEQVVGIVEDLFTMQSNNVSLRNCMLFMEGYVEKAKFKTEAPMSAWSEMLKIGESKKLSQNIYAFLEGWKHVSGLDKQKLLIFFHDFLRMLHQVPQYQKLQSNPDFLEHLKPKRLSQATRSVFDLQDWVEIILGIIIIQEKEEQKQYNIDEKIKRYIVENIDKPLNRQLLADLIGLNPDYVGKLFKLETGLSISSYILQERIKLAKALLINSDAQISSISLSVGYSNFSYFSMIFKKEVGVSPQEYRLQNQSKLSR